MDWNAFAGGFAKSYANNIDKRAAEERDFKMREKLMELESEYGEKLDERREARAKKKVDSKLSYPDYSSGKMIFTNSDGEKISERPLTAAEMEDYTFGRQKEKLTIEKTAGEIADRAADNARAERLANAQIGSYERSNRDGGNSSIDSAGGPKNEHSAANELIYRYKDVIDEAKTQGRISASQARAAAIAAVKNARTGSDAEDGFLRFLNTYGRKKGQ